MASDGIKIRIDTEADTTGAEQAAQSIEDLGASADQTAAATDSLADSESAEGKAQSFANVQRAKAIRSQREQAEVIKQIEANMRAMLAAQAAATAAAVAREFRNTSDAAAGASAALDSMASGMATFAATGNPVAAVAASLASSIGSAIKLYKDYNAEMALAAKAHDNAAKAAQRFEESRRRLAREVEQERLADTFAQEAREQQAAADAAERSSRLAEATREADRRISAAMFPGADTRVAAASDEVAGLVESLGEFEQRVKEAELAASQAARAFVDEAWFGTGNNEKLRDMRERSANLHAEAVSAAASLAVEQEATAKLIEAARVEAATAAADGAALAAEAQKVVAAIEALPPAERTAANLQTAADLKRVLENGLDPTEFRDVATAFEQMRFSRSETDNRIVRDLVLMIGNQQNTQRQLEALERQIRDLPKK